MEKKHGFKLLQAIPVETIEYLANKADFREKERLKNFLTGQLLRLIEQEFSDDKERRFLNAISVPPNDAFCPPFVRQKRGQYFECKPFRCNSLFSYVAIHVEI